MRKLTQAEATTVEWPKNATWKWPEVAYAMTSDSLKVEGKVGLSAANGDPLQLAYAVNFLETMYKSGYAVVDLRDKTTNKKK